MGGRVMGGGRMAADVKPLTRHEIARRAAQDIPDGAVVNLGIGLPTLVSDHLPADREIVFHSENGVLGVGPAPAPEAIDPDLINATKQPITLLPGGSFFTHTDAFVMIRGGHVQLALLGAFQVSQTGDLANWRTDDDRFSPAVGGAMDLAVGAREIRVLMEHTTRDGRPRILRQCTYPLTAVGVVRRIYTGLAVLDVAEAGMLVREMRPGLTLAALQAVTEAALTLAEDCGPLERPAMEPAPTG